ncbi:patatin-like phospholipase family protein [Roseivirga sp.]|uniref:patatin-like phospholipase family protein n=1 Tax=Roseivirga sp. TaxID=1964215 RepID=UPI003B8B50B9
MKVGIALSGGGARGIAHLGVLKALEELGITIDFISGTSAGSIVGAFYANGFSPEEIMKIVSKTNLFQIVWPAFSWKGIFSMSRSEDAFRKHFKRDDFSATKIPLKIVATNLNTGEPQVFDEGVLVKPMMASCCIPFVFDPININDQLYVDGGLVSNLPVEAIRKESDFVIAVNVSPVLKEESLGGTKKMIERISMVSINSNVTRSKKMCDLLIEPKGLRSYGTFDIKMAKEIFELGYEATHYVFENQKNEKGISSLLSAAKK